MNKSFWCIKQFPFPAEKFNSKLLNPIWIFYFELILYFKKSIQVELQAMKFGFLVLFRVVFFWYFSDARQHNQGVNNALLFAVYSLQNTIV